MNEDGVSELLATAEVLQFMEQQIIIKKRGLRIWEQEFLQMNIVNLSFFCHTGTAVPQTH